MKTRTKVLIAVGVTAGVAVAQFGGVTYDPIVNASVLQTLTQALQEYSQLVQMYKTMNAELAQIENAAKFATNKSAWLPSTVPTFPAMTTPNTYGTSAGLVQAMSTGSNVNGGYDTATIPLQPYSPAAWSSLSPSQQDTVRRQYATVELTDSVNKNALAIAGAYHAQQGSTNSALDKLTAQANSQNPADNTATALQNQQVAAALVQAREQQATNQLLAALVEQNAVKAKSDRDAAALGIQADVAERMVPSQPVGANQALAIRWN